MIAYCYLCINLILMTTSATINTDALNYVQPNDIDALTTKIQKWAADRQLDTADAKSQLTKVVEEVGEVAAAIARGNKLALQDGIGDVFVTLVILSQCTDLDFRACVEAAYNEIKNRKGKLVDGVFIKED